MWGIGGYHCDAVASKLGGLCPPQLPPNRLISGRGITTGRLKTNAGKEPERRCLVVTANLPKKIVGTKQFVEMAAKKLRGETRFERVVVRDSVSTRLSHPGDIASLAEYDTPRLSVEK